MKPQTHACTLNKSPRSAFHVDSGTDERHTPATVTPEFAEVMALPSAALFRIVSAAQDT